MKFSSSPHNLVPHNCFCWSSPSTKDETKDHDLELSAFHIALIIRSNLVDAMKMTDYGIGIKIQKDMLYMSVILLTISPEYCILPCPHQSNLQPVMSHALSGVYYIKILRPKHIFMGFFHLPRIHLSSKIW